MTDGRSTTASDSSLSYQDASRRQAALVGICAELASIGARINTHLGLARDTQLDALHERISDGVFRLMVIGHFNVGKSTLINTLLGDRVLPVRAIPTTAVITEIRWGERPGALLYSDGDEPPKPVELSELKKELTIPRSSPDAPNRYRRAQIEYPAGICRDGVRLIDSPGLEEHPDRERVTNDYLITADAIVFVQDANKYLSQPEIRYLTTRLADYEPFFVFTRVDVVEGEERPSVEEYA